MLVVERPLWVGVERELFMKRGGLDVEKKRVGVRLSRKEPLVDQLL